MGNAEFDSLVLVAKSMLSERLAAEFRLIVPGSSEATFASTYMWFIGDAFWATVDIEMGKPGRAKVWNRSDIDRFVEQMVLQNRTMVFPKRVVKGGGRCAEFFG
jgi:hypothetical protein